MDYFTAFKEEIMADYILYIFRVLIVIFIFVFITRIFMIVAAYIGEKLGFGKFFVDIWEKIKDSNKL